MTFFLIHKLALLESWSPGLSLLTTIATIVIGAALVYLLPKCQDIPNPNYLSSATLILGCAIGYAIEANVHQFNPELSNWLELIIATIFWLVAIALMVELSQVSQLLATSNNRLESKLAVELQQQRTIIRQQQQFIKNIYEDVREAIFIVDVIDRDKFIYQGFNPAAKRLTGIEDVVNKTPNQIFTPEVAAEIETHYRKCLQDKASISYEECLPIDGRDTWWLTSLNPLEDESGNIYRLIGTSLNISERKQAELELDRDRNFVRTLLDDLSDGIVSCDREGKISLFNQATRKFHGLPQQAIPAEQWAEHYDLYLPDGKTKMSKQQIPLFRALKGESVRGVEMMIIPKQGKARTLLANGDPIIDSNGVKIGAVVAMRDITARKKAEREVAELNSRLEARVKQRTAKLEQRNRELDEFAYAASHDLRAPLRAIANLSEWIEEDLTDKLDRDTQYKMNLLRGRVNRLENLINALLNYSRIGRLESEPQKVSVGEILTETIDSLNVPEHFQVEIEGQMPTLNTQLVPLQQVFSNLIANAIQHSDRLDTKITISVREQDNYYQFAVADNGKGIDPQYHERIFTIFQTLESRDTKNSTGVGLAIVKKAVEDRGGQIEVRSSLGRGTTFYFTWHK